MFIPPVDMKVTLPTLDMALTWPRLQIDQTAARSDIGLKPIGPLMREEAAAAQAVGTAAIAQISREGDRLARVEQSANAIAEIAAEKWPPLRELNVDSAPKERPKVSVEPGYWAFQFQPGQVIMKVPRVLGPGHIVDVSG